ncbi:hypothetical protein CR513_34596, partial [Mucuna pruriens]
MASENKQSENMQNKSTITNGVVITVYVESPRPRSIKPLEGPTKKTKPHPRFKMPQTTGTQGYDRRAQLLAYSRQLRENALLSQKKKRLLFAEPVRVCSPSTQMSQHECLELKGGNGINGSKKRKGRAHKFNPVLRKLKSILKKLSCKEIKGLNTPNGLVGRVVPRSDGKGGDAMFELKKIETYFGI